MRQFARICAVFLVCLLLINVMVIPASASVTAGLVTVGAIDYITSALLGLGITVATVDAFGDWNTIVSNCKTYLDGLGWINSDETFTVHQDENGIYYTPVSLLQTIKDWLFSSGTISSNPTSFCRVSFTNPIGESFSVSMYDSSDDFDVRVAYYIQAPGSSLYYFSTLLYSPKRFRIGKDGASLSAVNQNTRLENNDLYYYYSYHVQIDETSSLLSLYPHYERPYYALKAFAPLDPSVSTIVPDGISLGKIAPIPGTSVETNYEDWAENAIIIEFPVPPDPEEPEDPTDPSTPEEPTTPTPIKIPGFPLYIPSYPQTDVPSLPSQEEVQNPQPIEVPDPDPGVNPDPNPGVSGDPTPDIDPTLAPDNPADSAGEPPPFIDMTMNLKNFFPFCIPYDIYDFLNILAADPVAPEFDLKLFGLGEEFTLHIDLSPFDDLAALVRSFELMGFIIGLGIITRDKFLRG